MKPLNLALSRQRISGLFKRKWVNVAISLVMILITSVILGYLLYRQKDVLFAYQWKLNWAPLGIALLLHGITLLIGAKVWSETIYVLGVRLDFKQHFRLFCLNMLARRLPGTIWYVIYRAQAYTRFGSSVKATSLASGIELAVAAISGVITTFLFAFPIINKLHLNPLIFVFLLLGCIAFLNPRFLKFVLQKCSVEQTEIGPVDLIKWIAMYFISWSLGGIILFLFINFFYPLALSQVGYVMGCWVLVGTVSQAMVFLPSNFGFGEASLSLLLAQVIPSSIAVVVAIAARIIFIVFEIFWSVLSLILLKRDF